MQGIYSITCIQENRLYIGSSKNIERRWKDHKAQLNKERHHNIALQDAWDAYGDESFIFGVIEETEDLETREQFWLTKNIDICYNTTKIINNCMANPETVAKRKQTIIDNDITRGRQKLSKEQVYAIKLAYTRDSKVSIKVLAELYGVDRTSIQNILTERTWKDVIIDGFIPKTYAVKSQEIRDLVVDMYNKGYSIIEIKKASGYTSNGSIYDILKRQQGINPKRYKKQ